MTEQKTSLELTPENFKKANDAVVMRVKQGSTWTANTKKLLNALVVSAQKQHQARTGGSVIKPLCPLPTKDVPNPEDYFWIELPELKDAIHFNSNNIRVFINLLQQLQTTLVESDAGSTFTSVQVLGALSIIKGAGRRATLIGWEFPAKTRAAMLDPESFTQLDNTKVNLLKSSAAVTLYEIGKRYETNIGGLTRNSPWEWWYDYCTGSVVGAADDFKSRYGADAYRYFKRDTLMPALREIEATMDDIKLELRELKTGRRVTNLQFVVSMQPQKSMLFGSSFDIADPEPLMEKLGLTRNQAERIVGQFDGDVVRRNTTFMLDLLRGPKGSTVKSVCAYFTKACKDDYALSKGIGSKDPSITDVKIKKSKSLKSEPATPIISVTKPTNKNWESFISLTEQQQRFIIDLWLSEMPTCRRLKEGSTAYIKSFTGWLGVKDESWVAQNLTK